MWEMTALLICAGLFLYAIITSTARPKCSTCREPMTIYNVTDGDDRWWEWWCKGCHTGERFRG